MKAHTRTKNIIMQTKTHFSKRKQDDNRTKTNNYQQTINNEMTLHTLISMVVIMEWI